MPVLKEA